MKARIIIVILALTSSMVLLGQRSGTGAGETVFTDPDGLPAHDGAPNAVVSAFGADMPIGSIVVYAGSAAPEGWLMCDGELYDILAYPELFEVIEFTYGSNAAKDAFRVPNLEGKVPVGMANRIPFWYFNTLGKTGGETDVTLTESEMPSHKHDVSASSHSHGINISPHNHSVTVSAHSHSINDPGHYPKLRSCGILLRIFETESLFLGPLRVFFVRKPM